MAFLRESHNLLHRDICFISSFVYRRKYNCAIAFFNYYINTASSGCKFLCAKKNKQDGSHYN